MSIQTALQDATRRAAALDFSAENQRIAEIDAQLAQIERALQTARERREEVLLLLRPFTGAHEHARRPVLNDRDGSGMADALLAGVDSSEAAEQRVSREKLENERDALRDGMAELARRTRELGQERDEVKRAASRRTYEELRPLCAAYEEEARAAAETIVQCFAALSAIGRASSSNPPGLNPTATAVGALRGGDRLLRAGEAIDVPAEVIALAAQLAGKGSAYNGGVPRTVSMDAYIRPSAFLG